MTKLDVLYEDDHILVCIKPMGVPAQSDKTRDPDMITLVKKYLFDKYDENLKPTIRTSPARTILIEYSATYSKITLIT